MAMVLKDTLFKNMSVEKWDAVNKSKVDALVNLEAALSERTNEQLDAFVAFSSVSSLFGNVGQSNYSHANAACETIIERRCAKGLKACTIQWGMIDNVVRVLCESLDL